MNPTPEQAAWDILREAEDTDFLMSMARDRAACGNFLLPTTPGAFIFWFEDEAEIQEAQSETCPDEAEKRLQYAAVLHEAADRLRDLGFEPDAPEKEMPNVTPSPIPKLSRPPSRSPHSNRPRSTLPQQEAEKSYYTENQKMKPILEKAREFEIATNPAPEALFDAGNAGFLIWCTPDDHPVGWEGIPMTRAEFSKPCEYVASVHWGWEGERITYLVLSTEAFALSEIRDRTQYTGHNRPEDLAWAKEKIRWLFAQTDIPLLPIRTDNL